jgi:hypothetical protein
LANNCDDWAFSSGRPIGKMACAVHWMRMAKPKRPTVLLKSPVLKRSVKINGHQTSVSLENKFWDALGEIADAQNVRIS